MRVDNEVVESVTVKTGQVISKEVAAKRSPRANVAGVSWKVPKAVVGPIKFAFIAIKPRSTVVCCDAQLPKS